MTLMLNKFKEIIYSITMLCDNILTIKKNKIFIVML